MFVRRAITRSLSDPDDVKLGLTMRLKPILRAQRASAAPPLRRVSAEPEVDRRRCDREIASLAVLLIDATAVVASTPHRCKRW